MRGVGPCTPPVKVQLSWKDGSSVSRDSLIALQGPAKAACVFSVTTGPEFLPLLAPASSSGGFSPHSEGYIALALSPVGTRTCCEGLFPALAGCACLFQDQKDKDFHRDKSSDGFGQ